MNDMGAVCGTYEREGGAYKVLWEDLMERDHLEDLGLDGRIILKWVLQEVGEGGLEWNCLGQDRVRWRAVVNAVMNLRVS
jgi:hypothetical protein